MCIVLLTTAHPSYALIILDNRDEFILRPTSRPHWWTHEASGNKVLSARDLQRAEKGTWLGITDRGTFAVLTNYREQNTHDSAHPVHAKRSRGGMVTAWLGGSHDEDTAQGVHELVKDGGVKGVGGFSMVAGKLKKRKGQGEPAGSGPGLVNGNAGAEANGDGQSALEPIAIVSNRCDHLHDVPWIGNESGQVYGLSNTSYDDPKTWPKVANGKRLVREVIDEAVSQSLDEEQLVARLYDVLDTDTLPSPKEGAPFAEYISELKHSIFIPPIGDETHRQAMKEASFKGVKGQWDSDDKKAAEELERPDPADPATSSKNGNGDNIGFETGMYGTQRQTIVLVDWDGNVSYRERALWDSHGNPVERAKGDVLFRFKIQGWED